MNNSELPTERLIQRGKDALTDSELLSILIGNGNSRETALQLANRLLSSHAYNLNNFYRMSLEDLQKFEGIGKNKAILITAAIELGRRNRKLMPLNERITTSKDAYQAISHRMLDLHHEEFWVLLLNRQNKLIRDVQISKGGISGTVVDAKIVFKCAIDNLASGIILSHNHPSGNLQPSKEDIALTKKIANGACSLDIQLLDHLILTDNSYFSFADEGLI